MRFLLASTLAFAAACSHNRAAPVAAPVPPPPPPQQPAPDAEPMAEPSDDVPQVESTKGDDDGGDRDDDKKAPSKGGRAKKPSPKKAPKPHTGKDGDPLGEDPCAGGQ